MRDILAIACGGALGAVARHLTTSGARRVFGDDFPWGTLLVNLAGCFLLGMITEYLFERAPAAVFRGVTVGFLGALTTFSTFGHDTYRKLEDGRHVIAFGNIAANMIVGLIAVYLGVLAGRAILGDPIETT